MGIHWKFGMGATFWATITTPQCHFHTHTHTQDKLGPEAARLSVACLTCAFHQLCKGMSTGLACHFSIHVANMCWLARPV